MLCIVGGGITYVAQATFELVLDPPVVLGLQVGATMHDQKCLRVFCFDNFISGTWCLWGSLWAGFRARAGMHARADSSCPAGGAARPLRMRSARRVSRRELEACADFPAGSCGPGAGGGLQSPRDHARAAVARDRLQEPVTELGAEREATGSEVSAARAGPQGWARGARGALPRARAPRRDLRGIRVLPGSLAPWLSRAGAFRGRGLPGPLGSERVPAAQDSWEMRSGWWEQDPVLRVK